MTTQFYLFEGEDAAGNGDAIAWAGGDGYLAFVGTPGGTSFTVEYSPDNSVWYPTPIVAMTAAGAILFKLPRGYIRGVLTGGSGIDVSAFVRGV